MYVHTLSLQDAPPNCRWNCSTAADNDTRSVTGASCASSRLNKALSTPAWCKRCSTRCARPLVHKVSADALTAIGIGQPLRISVRSSTATFALMRSEEHTSELQSLMRNSYAVFCLKKKNK